MEPLPRISIYPLTLFIYPLTQPSPRLACAKPVLRSGEGRGARAYAVRTLAPSPQRGEGGGGGFSAEWGGV